MSHTVRVLSEDADLQTLLSRLKQHGRVPYNLTASSLLVATLSGLRHVEAVVDTWPDFTALVLRDRKDVFTDGLLIPEILLYTSESTLESLERLLKTDGVIAWDTSFGISALAVEHLELLKELVCQRGGKLETGDAEPGCPYQYDVTDADIPLQLPPGFKLGELREEHASVILAGWEYKPTTDDLESTMNTIRNNLRCLPSAAVFTAEGQPVSWITTYLDLSLGRGNTLPSYRGKGLYGLTIRHLARRHIQLFPQLLFPYLWVVQDNRAARAATLRSNFREWPEQFWYYIYHPPTLAC